MDPHLLRRAVKREVNKLTAPCFQLIGEKLINLLPENGCPSTLSIFHEVILQFACNNDAAVQDVYADLLLILKYRYVATPHICTSACGGGAAAEAAAKAAREATDDSSSGSEALGYCHSFGEILTLVILGELDRYPANLSDVSTLVYGLYDEEDVETCVRQRRQRLIGLLTFVAKLYTRAVIKICDLSKIFGMFIEPEEDEEEEEEGKDPTNQPRCVRRRNEEGAAAHLPVTLDETHLEGLLKAFVIMGHQLEQSSIGREWISSIIQSLPERFQNVLTQARAHKWVTIAIGTNKKLLRALQSQQIVDNDPCCRHRPYMGNNVDYPNYIMKQEAIWRIRNRDGCSSLSGPLDPLETEQTVEPVVSFRDPLEEGWLYDPDSPPHPKTDFAGPTWREYLTSRSPVSTSSRASPASSVAIPLPLGRSRPSQRNSIACNIERSSESFCHYT